MRRLRFSQWALGCIALATLLSGALLCGFTTSEANATKIFTAAAPTQKATVADDSPPSETPTRADDFVDTIGFNAHFEDKYSIYSNKFAQVKSLLVDAGIRHVRVGMVFKNPNLYEQMQELAAAGTRGLYITLSDFTQSQLLEYPSLVGASFEAYEAPNEPDKTPDPDWAPKTRAFLKNLYTWVKADPRTRDYPVVGPSVTDKFEELGDISAYEDIANTHNYLDVFNPNTTGFGGRTPFGIYGSIAYNLNRLKITSGNKPVYSTENGYGATPSGGMTPTNKPQLDYRAQLRYIPRLFLEQFLHGILRTYVYEFIDRGGNRTYDHYGVVETDLTPKPAYTAVKSMIARFSDKGPVFTTKPLAFELGGSTANVHHLLLEKRDGEYILPIWLEVLSWQPHGGGDIIVPDQQVTLTTPASLSSASLATMNENGTYSTRSLTIKNGEISFPVSDKVSLLTLKP